MFRKLSLVLVTVLVTFSLGVRALGLGEIKLKSGLNQPLKAEIELFSPEGMSEFEVAASLASMTEFEKAGIDYFGYLKNIRFKTIKGPNDTLKIEVTTRQPVKEPFLNFLVELNWPKGRMLREYTLLLDPPIFAENKASTVDQATSAPAQVQARPTQTTRAYQPETTSSPSDTPVFSGESYGPVGEAETLWRIATKVRPSGATIHQTLVALYRANPQAFVNKDINLLKKGAVLTVPGGSEIASIPHRAALQDMVARTRGNQRDTILDTSGRTTSSRNVVRGEDRLRLAAPEDGEGTSSGSGTGSTQQVSTLRNELVRTKEAAATLEAENEELRRKLQEALTQLEQKSSAVDVESTAAAALANRDRVFADDETTTDDLDSETSEASSSELSSDQSDTALNTSDSQNNRVQTGDDATDDTSSQSSSSIADNANPTGTSDSTSPSPVSQQTNERPSSSLSTSSPPQSSSLFDDPLYMYGALGLVVVLLGAFLVFWRMRQRMSDEEFQDDLVISAQGSSFDTEESIDMPDVGDDLLGDLDSDDVFEEDGGTEADPLGEADIYIAYGKYDQAEKLLMDAIDAQPDRTDLKVKLLECYAENKEKDKFDAVENQFNDIWDEDADAAEQVRNIKVQAWPDEASLDDEFELPSTEEIFGDDDQGSDNFDDEFSLDDLDTESDVSLEDDIGTPEIGGEEASFETDDLDFDLDAETDSSTAAEDDFSLDDELLSLETEEPEAASSDLGNLDFDEMETESSVDDIQDTDLDSDLDLDLDATDDLDLDLDSEFDLEDEDSLDDDIVDGTDEASTKLDLARAYIDMGDTDGAREILNEVVEEGSEAHKNEALSLLEKI